MFINSVFACLQTSNYFDPLIHGDDGTRRLLSNTRKLESRASANIEGKSFGGNYPNNGVLAVLIYITNNIEQSQIKLLRPRM